MDSWIYHQIFVNKFTISSLSIFLSMPVGQNSILRILIIINGHLSSQNKIILRNLFSICCDEIYLNLELNYWINQSSLRWTLLSLQWIFWNFFFVSLESKFYQIIFFSIFFYKKKFSQKIFLDFSFHRKRILKFEGIFPV